MGVAIGLGIHESHELHKHLAFTQNRVRTLLDRLSLPDRATYIQNKYSNTSVRFSLSDYQEEFPGFVFSLFTQSPCFPVHPDGSCNVLARIPRLPTFSSPIEFEKGAILSFSHLKQFYGPASNQYYSSKLLPSYLEDSQCNYDNFYDTQMYKEKEVHRNHFFDSGVSPDCPQSPNIIITVAEGYNCNRYSLYLRSLRDSGVCADVYIITTSASNRTCEKVEMSCGRVRTIPFGDKYPEVHHEISRYIIALEFLKEYIANRTSFQSESAEERSNYSSILCAQVLFTDFGDVFFQRNPFTSFLHKSDAEVILTEESYDPKGLHTTIRDEPTGSNAEWFKAVSEQILGRDIVDQVGDMPAINCGLILGTLGGMYKFLWAYAYLTDMLYARDYQGLKGITAQGNLNFAYYTGFFNSVVNVRVLSPSASVFVNSVYHHPSLLSPTKPFDFQKNPFVNAFRQPYAVVHMFNRPHMMAVCGLWVLSYAGLNGRFKPLRPAKLCSRRLNDTAKPQ